MVRPFLLYQHHKNDRRHHELRDSANAVTLADISSMEAAYYQDDISLGHKILYDGAYHMYLRSFHSGGLVWQSPGHLSLGYTVHHPHHHQMGRQQVHHDQEHEEQEEPLNLTKTRRETTSSQATRPYISSTTTASSETASMSPHWHDVTCLERHSDSMSLPPTTPTSCTTSTAWWPSSPPVDTPRSCPAGGARKRTTSRSTGASRRVSRRLVFGNNKNKTDDETLVSPVSGTRILPSPPPSPPSASTSVRDRSTPSNEHETKDSCDSEVPDLSRTQLATIENRLGEYACTLCGRVYDDAFRLAQHRCPRIVHVQYRCDECCKVFTCPANLASHRRWHRPRATNTDTDAATTSSSDIQLASKSLKQQKHGATPSRIKN